MARTQTEIRAAVVSRPQNALQVFDEAAMVPAHKDFYCSFPNFGDRIVLEKTFTKRPALNAVRAFDMTGNDAADLAVLVAADIADSDFEVLGTNMTTALCTFDAEGWLKLTTAGANNDQAILCPHLDTNMTAWSAFTWGTDQETEVVFRLRTGSAVTAQKIVVGLKLTNALDLSTDANSVHFKYDTGGAVSTTKWTTISSIANTDVETDSGIAVAADTTYILRILIDANRIARFYINGEKVYESTALTDAIDLIPYAGIQALTGAAKHFKINKVAIGRKAA